MSRQYDGRDTSAQSPQSPATGANALPAFPSPTSREPEPDPYGSSHILLGPVFGRYRRPQVLPTPTRAFTQALPLMPGVEPPKPRSPTTHPEASTSDPNPPIEASPWRVPRYLRSSKYHQVFTTSPNDARHKIPLPSHWDTKNCCDLLAVASDGLQVNYRKDLTKSTDKDAAAVRANHPAPVLSGIYYYEVQILSKGRSGYIGLGFSGPKVNLSRLPGWEGESYGYHGDDGNVFCSHGTGTAFGPTFTTGDVVGCGIDFVAKRCFFTKNGSLVGHCFKDVVGELYPSIGLRTFGECIKANFGQQEFHFDIEQYMEDQKSKLLHEILAAPLNEMYLDEHDAALAARPAIPDDADSENKAASQSIESTLAALITSYLNFNGHADTAAAFKADRARVEDNISDIKPQTAAMNVDEDSTQAPDGSESGESVRERKRIIEDIASGRSMEAHQRLREQFPLALDQAIFYGVPVDFALRSRHFLESILRLSRPSNAKDASMDVDQAAVSDKVSGKASARTEELGDDQALDEILAFGQELHKDYSHSDNETITSHLLSLSSLLAYQDPREASDPEIQAMVVEAGQAGREALAAEVNGAVHASLHRNRRSTFDRIRIQNVLVRNQLARRGEGVAAFLNLW